MKHIFFTCILGFGLSGLLSAQITDRTTEVPYIEVTGNAELNIIPDEIFIDIQLNEKYDGKTKISIQEQEEKMRADLLALGIPASDIMLNSADADFMRINWKTDDVLTRKKYTVKVKDAATAGKVFKELSLIDIKTARIARVDHTKMDSLLKEVKILAIKAAKNKADYLLNAIGQQCGNALIIMESPSNSGLELELMNVSGVMRQNRRVETEEFSGGYDDDAIQFRKIQLRSSIYVKFAIKP